MRTQPTPTPYRPSSSPWRRRLITLGIVTALGAFAWSQLPEGSYPTDLSRIGQGRFDRRLDEFVAMRVRLYEAHGSIYRASVHNAAAHSRVRDELERNRELLREQFALQFAPELNVMADSVRASAVEAGNVLTQLDSIDLLRGSRHLTAAETTAVICDTLRVLLAPRV